ncbi:hypothetical protein [Nocardia yamanashiensis]|uniref:hypothetical protein n=1 Tax=Nocardia yamanashiensis TaxID=209247 RepID=UPI00082BE6A7|nr:hypothetical protein [Nocardia yamanashiensis]
MERLRRKLEAFKPAESATPETGDDSKVIRLPRRPRRASEEAGEPPQRPWLREGGSAYDPAPTRPVTRQELQRETGWWPVDPGRAGHPAPESEPGAAEHDGSVIDLGALRRKRAGEDAPAPGNRRRVRPRRIDNGEGADGGQDDDRD